MKNPRTLLLLALGAVGNGLGGCASSDVSTGESVAPTDAASALRARFPAHASVVLEGQARFEPSALGLSPVGRSLGEVRLILPEQGDGAVHLRVDAPDAPFELRVLEDDLGGPAENLGTAVAYPRRRGTSYWMVGADGPEEWLSLEQVRRGEVAAAWVVEGGTLRAAEGAIEILDAREIPRIRVTAPAAYAPDGRAVEAKLAARDGRIELSVDADGEVLVDPMWTSTASMPEPRAFHTATTLSTGKILVAGGTGSMGILASAVLYDPSTNTWSAAGSMTSARTYHTATPLASGRVLVVGGQGSKGPLAPAELYDAPTGTWLSAGQLAHARRYHTATLLPSGKVLVAGGTDNYNAIAAAEIFDPATNLWSSAGSLATARSLHVAMLLPGGDVLIAGGHDGTSYLSSTEIYHPATSTFTAGPSLVQARAQATATALPSGKMLVVGGDNIGLLKSTELYDPSANTWSAAAPLAFARSGHTVTLLPNGKALVAGGAGNLQSVELYDEQANTWTATASLTTGRTSHTASLLPGGVVLVAGGQGNSGTSAERYTGKGDLCTQAAQCPSGFCVDGVCCDTACNAGPCDTCVKALGASADGVCTLLTGPSCDDGDACTQASTCQAGVCVGGSPVTCPAPDPCHTAGTCNPATGLCSNPAQPDGSTCDDGNAQTMKDACTGGICVGVLLCAGVVCTAQDQCHVAGTCDPTTGVCSNPPKADGSACDDGDINTGNDVCTAGVCAGVDHCIGVTCTASDECHDAGTCIDHATGACDNPVKTDGTPCSLGTCQQGTCTASPDAGTGGSGGAGAGGSGGAGTGGSGGAGAGGSGGAGTSGSGGAGTGGSGGAGTGETSSSTSDSSSSSGGTGGGASEDGGCGCRMTGGERHDGRGWMGALGFALILARRRRTVAASRR